MHKTLNAIGLIVSAPFILVGVVLVELIALLFPIAGIAAVLWLVLSFLGYL